ncbi:MAG: tRNA pseudouridine synthase A [Candidatus Eremiobacteraeota bacterium]|nr:tRNA pseudouridine synthase A [Candidatus Eremiobacteraeota bacterium]
MVNYKATLRYDGTKFFGFQTQKGPRILTIQDGIQSVLSKIFNNPVKIFVAGRTDTGVHATGQVINFKVEREMSPKRLQIALNGLLDRAISVSDVAIVDPDFHAGHNAKCRKYLYILDNSPNPDALKRNRAYWHPYRLDIESMKEAIKQFEGEHDFSRFAKGNREVEKARRKIISTEIRTSEDFDSFKLKGEHTGQNSFKSDKLQKENSGIISAIKDITILSNHLIFFHFKGLSFLHSMVRLMVGNLIEVGKGKLSPDDIGRMLIPDYSVISHASKVPGMGLYLVGVEY